MVTIGKEHAMSIRHDIGIGPIIRLYKKALYGLQYYSIVQYNTE